MSKRIAMLAAILVASLLPTAMLGASRSGGGKTCTNVPVTITVLSGGAIASDGGSYAGFIDICSIQTPTYDARMDLTNVAGRSVLFTFPRYTSLYSGAPPVWADGVTTFPAKPNLWVRNILYGLMTNDPDHTFTTRLILKNIVGPGDSRAYDLRIQAPSVDAVTNDPPQAETNLPYATAKVTVVDSPGTCRTGGISFDSWLVTVDTTPVDLGDGTTSPGGLGTLWRIESTRKYTYTHAGQYFMPIQMRIDAQACVPATLIPNGN